jgi:ring-1,2-phenylacetyl-CoA epoxidase subunit PaaC
MFVPAEFESNNEDQVNVDVSNIKIDWYDKVSRVSVEATLALPTNTWMQGGGKKGIHTEHLGYILAEMQYLQRTYPGLEW